MLFHIKQTHAPADCPYGKGGSTSLFDGESTDVKIHGYWLGSRSTRRTSSSRRTTSPISRRSSGPEPR